MAIVETYKLVWVHKNGRTYRRKLKTSKFIVPANAVKVQLLTIRSNDA